MSESRKPNLPEWLPVLVRQGSDSTNRRALVRTKNLLAIREVGTGTDDVRYRLHDSWDESVEVDEPTGQLAAAFADTSEGEESDP